VQISVSLIYTIFSMCTLQVSVTRSLFENSELEIIGMGLKPVSLMITRHKLGGLDILNIKMYNDRDWGNYTEETPEWTASRKIWRDLTSPKRCWNYEPVKNESKGGNWFTWNMSLKMTCLHVFLCVFVIIIKQQVTYDNSWDNRVNLLTVYLDRSDLTDNSYEVFRSKLQEADVSELAPYFVSDCIWFPCGVLFNANWWGFC